MNLLVRNYFEKYHTHLSKLISLDRLQIQYQILLHDFKFYSITSRIVLKSSQFARKGDIICRSVENEELLYNLSYSDL